MSLHEDLDAWRGEYTEPRESDGIRVTNEVDRSHLVKLRRLGSLRSSGRDDRNRALWATPSGPEVQLDDLVVGEQVVRVVLEADGPLVEDVSTVGDA